MLIDDEKKFVETVVDNIIWGNVTIDWGKMPLSKKGHPALSDLLPEYIDCRKHDTGNPDLPKLIEDLAMIFEIEIVFGSIKGELKDRDNEKKLQDVELDLNLAKQTIKEITENMIKLQTENDKLKKHNILLAGELEDQKNIINSYEKATLGGK